MDWLWQLVHYKFDLWTPKGFYLYFSMIFIGAISCSFILRWATSDSYNLPAYRNNKRLNFSTNLSDAGSTSFYRVQAQKKEK